MNENKTFIVENVLEKALNPVKPQELAQAKTNHFNNLSMLSKEELIAKSNAGCPYSRLILRYNMCNFSL